MKAISVQNVDGIAISLSAEALHARDTVIAQAKGIATVSTADELQVAAVALRTLKGFLTKLESSRKEVKNPILEKGREIDRIAKDSAGPVEAEVARINRLVLDFQRAEMERADRQRKFRESMERKKREAAEAEARRLREQAAGAIIPEEAEALRQQSEAAQERAEAQAIVTVQAPPKAEGVSVKKDWFHEVVDLHALYRARPDLVTLEPKTAAINAAIRQNGMRDCPGLRIFEDLSTRVRA